MDANETTKVCPTCKSWCPGHLCKHPENNTDDVVITTVHYPNGCSLHEPRPDGWWMTTPQGFLWAGRDTPWGLQQGLESGDKAFLFAGTQRAVFDLADYLNDQNQP